MFMTDPIPTMRRELYVVAFALALLAVLALAVDLPIARACRPDPTTRRNVVPKSIQKFFTLSEVYAHGAGIASIAITLFLCDTTRRRRIPRLLLATFGAGLAADVVKFLLIARQRPSAADLNGSVLDTFVAWFPLLSDKFADQPYTRSFQSCPSAHSAAAAGLSVALATLYPNGRWWFAFLALASMLQRIDAGAHFPSDTLAGAALGCFIGSLAVAGQTYGAGGREPEGSEPG